MESGAFGGAVGEFTAGVQGGGETTRGSGADRQVQASFCGSSKAVLIAVRTCHVGLIDRREMLVVEPPALATPENPASDSH